MPLMMAGMLYSNDVLDWIVGRPRGAELLFAAGAGDRSAAEDIDRALMQGANVDERRSCGRTPLMIACSAGDVTTARALLTRGADPCAQTTNGLDATDFAAAGNHDAVVELLMDRGVDPNRLRRAETLTAFALRYDSFRVIALLRARTNTAAFAPTASADTP